MAVEQNKESRLIEDDERIANYLKGMMTEVEEAQFVSELKVNDELRERAVIQAKVIKAMQQVDSDVIEAFRNSSSNKLKQSNIKTKIIPLRKWMAIAASLLILFVGFKSYDYYRVTGLGREYALQIPSYSQVRGDVDEETQNELNSLFAKVETGEDLTSTIATLENMWQEANKNTYNKYTDYAPYIGWNLTIAYLRNYDKSKAKEILKEMRDEYSDETDFGKQVRNLIDNL